jgi:signal transduction histidine kinase
MTRRRVLGDIALAAALAVVSVMWTFGADQRTPADAPIDAFGFSLVGGTALALAARRRWPLGTLAVTTSLTSTYLLLSYPYGPILVAFLVSVYTVARHVPLTRSVPACLVALAVLLTHVFTNDAALPGFLGLVPGSAWVVVPFAVGSTVRLSAESTARARTEAVRQGVDEERLRVAQEVHDVVGHGLAAIKMQADIALHLLPKDPAQAKGALEAISRTSTEALDDLRGTLAVVRGDDADSPRAPAPDLARLEDLCRRMEDAGVRVTLEVSGSRRDLPTAVELAGYRVVQEALTNVLRHGDEKAARVRADYQPDVLCLTVSNSVTAGHQHGNGLGIPGMRHRVTSLGGELTAGATADGRFEVHAVIPTGGQP